MLQTILGASGTIGNPLAKELAKTNTKIRLVSRNPQKVNDTDELLSADLTDPTAVDKAVAGSGIVYVTVGFEYSAKVWRATWPPFIQAVVEGCKKHQAKLVFFDNMYMYDSDHLSHMTEDTPINPKTEKGKIRAEVVQIIWHAVKAGEIEAIIARAADFIGGKNSVYGQTVIDNLKNGKKANWLISAKKLHNYTYVNDAARAVANLGNASDTWNQTWHLPSTQAKTGEEWVKIGADLLGVKPKLQVMPGWMLSLVGLFMPIMKEVKEMSYQWGNDYFFDSSKFEARFNEKATDAKQAIAQTLGNTEVN